jgi:hypothetical protein
MTLDSRAPVAGGATDGRPTFAEAFCRRHALAPGEFEAAVLRGALYPMARVLRPLLALDRDYFAPDRDFVRGVGRLRTAADFMPEAEDFAQHPENRGLLRRRLRLRVSARRLHRLVEATLRS